MPALKLITPPDSEPVTLAEAKAHLRIDDSNDDDLITALITSARLWAELYTKRAFIAQSWQYALDAEHFYKLAYPVLDLYFPLPRPPLMSVTSVTFYDYADTATIWPVANYFVDNNSVPARLCLRMTSSPVNSLSFSTMRLRPLNCLIVNYSCGYGSASDVPTTIKTAILQIVAHWYEHRGEAILKNGAGAMSSLMPVPLMIQALLNPFRMTSLQ